MLRNKADLLDSTTAYRNRNRLTSTPRDDTNLSAMDSSFRDNNQTAQYSPFSPESLDATQFTPRDHFTHSSPSVSAAVDSPSLSSVIIGPCDDLGLNFYQSVTTARPEVVEIDGSVDDNMDPAAPCSEDALVVDEASPDEAVQGLQVNLEQWNEFLERAYVNNANPLFDQLNASDDLIRHQLKDSGIARPSFSESLDILGSTFDDHDSHLQGGGAGGAANLMDDLSLVARLWNEQLAAALAMESQLMADDETGSEQRDHSMTSSVSESGGGGGPSPLKLETYYSYDKIDDDILRQSSPTSTTVDVDVDVAVADRRDLSTIREERESVSSSEMVATPKLAETGSDILSQLQLKSRLQRQLDANSPSSDSSDSSRYGSEREDQDEDGEEGEDVLVVDLEGKRAILMEGQSPQLKAAMVSDDYESIFGDRPAPHIMLRSSSSSSAMNNHTAEDVAEKIQQDNQLVQSEDSQQDSQEDEYVESEEEEEEEDGEEVEEEEEEDGQNTSNENDEGGDECNNEDNDEDYDDDEEEEAEDDDDDGIESSNFVWKASYPMATKTPLAMQVIEEECEEEDEEDGDEVHTPVRPFVPSTWRCDLTPTRSAIKSPEKSQASNSLASAKKNVSFVKSNRNAIYEYPGEEEPPPPSPRRQWAHQSQVATVPSTKEPAVSAYANVFADWEFAAEDNQDSNTSEEPVESDQSVDSVVQLSVAPSRPASIPLSSSVLYRLSDIGDDGDDDDDDDDDGDDDDDNDDQGKLELEDDVQINSKTVPSASQADGYFSGEWPAQFSLSEFQPDEFFPNWNDPNRPKDDDPNHVKANAIEDVTGNTPSSSLSFLLNSLKNCWLTNKFSGFNLKFTGGEESMVAAAVGTLRHTRDSLRLDFELSQPHSDSEA